MRLRFWDHHAGTGVTLSAAKGLQETRPHVLVAEDEQILRMEIAEGLIDAGYDVIEASDAIDAMHEIAEQNNITALLTDIRMSASDGLDLAHKVRRLRPDIAIVLISGVLEPSEAERPEGARFLLKPCRIARIVAVVGDTIQARR